MKPSEWDIEALQCTLFCGLSSPFMGSTVTHYPRRRQ